MISRSIQQESQVFIAKIIHEDSFRNTKSIRSIEFSEDPKLYVIENNEYSQASDVYAFAFIMFEDLSNEKPFVLSLRSKKAHCKVKLCSGPFPYIDTV